MTDKNQIIKEIRAGETSLGIEFGSTRIKAVLVGKEHAPIASGSYEWENQLVEPSGEQHLDLQPGRYLERIADQLSGTGKRCKRTVRRDPDKDRIHGIQCHDARLYAI